MTREELWQLQSIQHKLERRRQNELADSGDTSKSIIWRSQSHGEVVAYDNALKLIHEFLKGEIMKTNEVKKEPNTRALLRRKVSQGRVKMLLQISKELTDTARTAEGDLQEKYQKISEKLDRLIIEEAKFQEQTMQDVQQQP
jgi:hypothetical protein